jgi:hypothetical protein
MRVLALAILAVSLMLAACAVPDRRQSTRAVLQENPDRSPPACQGAEDCEAKWSAARRWVNTHAGFRLQIYSADYMETYWSPDADSADLSVRVEREPLGGGRYNLRVAAGCQNPSGCVPDARAAMLDFDTTVAAARIDAARSGSSAPKAARGHRKNERLQPPPGNF